jgi:hypothetical protein
VREPSLGLDVVHRVEAGADARLVQGRLSHDDLYRLHAVLRLGHLDRREPEEVRLVQVALALEDLAPAEDVALAEDE